MLHTARLLMIALALGTAPAFAQFSIDTSVGIWVNASELAQLPMTGDAWDDLYAVATGSCSVPDLTLQDDNADQCILAKAIVYRRLVVAKPGDATAATIRADVLTVLGQMMDEDNWCENGACIPGAGMFTRTTLAVGRNLGAYITAAELIGLDSLDTPSKSDLIAFLEGTGDPADPEEIETGILEYEWIDSGTVAAPLGRRRLREAHDERPNNWGGHACASLAAAAIYRDEPAELLHIYDVALGWTGDCTNGDCSQFEFGVEAQDWTCNNQPPQFGINQDKACILDVDVGPRVEWMSMNGAQVDDMRRGGPFPAGCGADPPACVADSHIWSGLQGRIACAWILLRQGLDVFSGGDAALRRSYRFQHLPIWMIAGVPGQPHPAYVSQDGSANDDAYLTYIVNHVYREGFPHDPAPGGIDYHDFGKGWGGTRYTLGENPCFFYEFDPDFDGLCDPASLPTGPPWALPLAGGLIALGARPLLARVRTAGSRR
jgi:hypothetical protein